MDKEDYSNLSSRELKVRFDQVLRGNDWEQLRLAIEQVFIRLDYYEASLRQLNRAKPSVMCDLASAIVDAMDKRARFG